MFLVIFLLFLSFPETEVVVGLTIFVAFFVCTLTWRMDIKENFIPERF
jgi:hypothetical protein